MKTRWFLPFTLLGCAVLLSSFSQPARGLSQTMQQLRTPAEGSAEHQAILEAVRQEYKEGADQPSKFQVNYLKVHSGWAWINVTPLDASGKSVGDPAPLLFYQENGKWAAKDLNDVPAAGDGHTGPHDPNPQYIKALQKKYPGVPVEIIPASSHAEDPIATIRAQFASINKSAGKYKKVKKELTGFSLEGGELVAYFDGAKLMKIVANHYGESGKGLDEFYYWDDQLIFIYRKDSTYDRPGSGKVVRTRENRFYFNNGRLIRWIGEDGQQVAAGSEEYVEKEKDYLSMSKELANGARSQKPTIESASTP